MLTITLRGANTDGHGDTVILGTDGNDAIIKALYIAKESSKLTASEFQQCDQLLHMMGEK